MHINKYFNNLSTFFQKIFKRYLGNDRRGDLVTQREHGSRRRTDEHDISGGELLGQFRILGSVAPTGPDRIDLNRFDLEFYLLCFHQLESNLMVSQKTEF